MSLTIYDYSLSDEWSPLRIKIFHGDAGRVRFDVEQFCAQPGLRLLSASPALPVCEPHGGDFNYELTRHTVTVFYQEPGVAVEPTQDAQEAVAELAAMVNDLCAFHHGADVPEVEAMRQRAAEIARRLA